MPTTFHVEEYLKRINFTGPCEPTLDTLNKIMFCHATSVPFENLDVLLGLDFQIDFESVFDKIVTRRRGGYCFEQNNMLCALLSVMGFSVRAVGGRFRWQRERSFDPARTHMQVLADIDGAQYLVDVSLGLPSLTRAVKFVLGEVQETSHDKRRIIQHSPVSYLHQLAMEPDGEWLDVCEFTLDVMPPADCEMGHWYCKTHPKSNLIGRLIIAMATPEGRLWVLNDSVVLRHHDGRKDSEPINSADELLNVLASRFGLHFAPKTRFVRDGGPEKPLWPVE